MKGHLRRHIEGFHRELLLGLLTFGLLYWLVPVPHDAGLPLQLVHHLCVLVASFGIWLIWRLARRWRLVIAVLDAASMDDSGSKAVQSFIQQSVERLGERVKSLHEHSGAAITDDSDLSLLSASLFTTSTSPYVGIDSHHPSLWMKKYSGFLAGHEKAIRPESARILAVSEAKLREDFAADTQVFQKFVTWHRSNGVVLLQVDPAVASQHASTCGLTPYRDVAVWLGDCAALFDPSSTTRVRIVQASNPSYENAILYLELVNGAALEIRLRSGAVVLEKRAAEESRALANRLRRRE